MTVDLLASMLKKEHDIWLAPGFGAWRETAFRVPPELRDFNPEVVFILLDFHFCAPLPDLSESIEITVAALEAALPRTTVIVPDLEDLEDSISSLRPSTFCDDRMWAVGSMPWSLAGLRAIRDEINRLLRVMKDGRKKVLALDLDNTIWEGVIGEDGIGGVRPMADLQREIRTLRERGVLLVGLSKNNEADVEPVWNDSRMVLKREDFVDLRIDWNDKAANLEAVAKSLNLDTDSFVFVDDNPVERAELSAVHPEVAIVDWPIPVRRLVRLYFPKLRVTDEDRQKTEQYEAEKQRKRKAAALSFDDYLAGLEIRTEIHPVVESEFQRVAQLSQKSNQFNVCTNRYAVDDVVRFASDPSHLIVTLHAGDKFGDQGLVAFVHAARIEDNRLSPLSSPSTFAYRIVDWVMSCRAMGRRLEFTVQQWLENELRRRGATRLLAAWRKTAKNEPVRDLFEKFGFSVVHSETGEKRYEKVSRFFGGWGFKCVDDGRYLTRDDPDDMKRSIPEEAERDGERIHVIRC